MSKITKQILFWSPRVLCLAFAAFLSIFALDVFDEHLGFWRTALALVMHLLPTFFLLAVLALAWKREWLGAVTYLGFATLYIATIGRSHWSWSVLIGGPPALVGILFLVNWLKRDQLHHA